MIENPVELQVAVRNLGILERSQDALQDQLNAANPDLLAVSAPAYKQRIQELQREIAAYLYDHPEAVSELIRMDLKSADLVVGVA